MPELFKLLARNGVIGVLAGWLTMALLIYTNTGGLGDVIMGASNPFLPIAILAGGFTITFGSLAMGAAIMAMPYDHDDGGSSGQKVATLAATFKAWMSNGANDERSLSPIPVKANNGKGRRRG